MDVKSPADRSKNMAAVRSRNTGPEVRLRRALWRAGVRFFTSSGWHRLTKRRLPGSPDVILPRSHTLIFVDGCFWHGCPLHYTAPDERGMFWANKLAENRERDRRVLEQLVQQGWTVHRIWEHETRARVLPETVERLLTELGRSTTLP